MKIGEFGLSRKIGSLPFRSVPFFNPRLLQSILAVYKLAVYNFVQTEKVIAEERVGPMPHRYWANSIGPFAIGIPKCVIIELSFLECQ